ncbi:TPA: hypothetical protein ACH3X3_005911 [Trebouxia sp. C0006]
MSELVQTNLHRLINKSQKRRSAPHEDEPCPVLKRPSLLTRLADSSDQSQPVKTRTQHLHRLSTLAETAARRDSDPPSAASGQCPVCGYHMAADLLPAHVEQELSVLADEDASCTVSMSNAQTAASTQPHRPGPLQPLQSSARRPNGMWEAESSHRPQHSKVMVLGGTHNDIQATVSHGRRSKRHQIRAFDHYSNGGGTWDSDMVGLDGLTEPDSTWEGRGVISLGR